MKDLELPRQQGLYSPQYEHDACGIGMLANIKGVRSHRVLTDALEVLNHLSHRGGTGAEPDTGDGAGILTQLPDTFFRKICPLENMVLPAPGAYGVGMLSPIPMINRPPTALISRITTSLSKGAINAPSSAMEP